MIFSSVLDPNILSVENFDTNSKSLETLRMRFLKNLILILDKDGKIKKDFGKKLQELKKKPNTKNLRFINTFEDFIIKKNKKIYITNVELNNDILKFASNVRNQINFLDAIITNKTNYGKLDPKVEFVSIEDFDESALYTKLISCDLGTPTSLDQLKDDEFNQILMSLFWNTNYIHFYDETLTSSIRFDKVKNKCVWKNTKYKDDRYSTLNFIKNFLIRNNLNNKGQTIKIFTSIPPFLHHKKESIKNTIYECIPESENNINFFLKLKLRDTPEMHSHKRYMDVNSCLIDTDVGIDFLTSDLKRKKNVNYL